MLAEHDAALIIGDPALQVNRQKYHTYDLAEIWIRLTGKPFVFAFWAARTWAMEQRADVGVVFRQSRDHGLIPDNIHAIALTWAERLGLAPQDAEQYLTQNIYYYLDSETTAGLNLFYTYAAEIGALPPAPALRFDEVSSAIPGRG
jgi:chorismate dehydratase